jgi:ribosomal protein S18 acetylase RimI-like enzyme
VTIGYRRPTSDDLEAVLGLINDPASVHRQVACRHGEAPEPAGQLYDRLDEDDNLLVELDGVAAAYASWQTYGRHAHLNVLSVAGAYQRRGLGEALFKAFLAEAADMGATSFSLRAYRDSAWAIGFYARQGLAPVEQVAPLCRMDAGFKQYIDLSVANGQWPAPEKVLFYGGL